MIKLVALMIGLFSRLVSKTYTILILAIISYIIFALFSDVAKFTRAITESQITRIPLILTPLVISLLLLGTRFHRLMHALGIKTSLGRSVMIYLAGLSLLVTPAGAGQMIKSRIIKKEFGDAVSKTSPIVSVETWSSLQSAIVIVMLFLLFKRIVEAQIIATIGGIMVLIIAGIMKNQRLFDLFKKLVGRFGRFKKFEGMIENSRSSCNILMRANVITEGFALTIPARLLEALCVFIVFQDLGFKLNYVLSTEIYFTSLISGMLSFIPGGFIITEGSMLGLLAKYGNHSIAEATAAVLFTRLSTIWFSTIVGLITVRLITSRIREGVHRNQRM